ncbi:MAG TPA: TonB-dependent receptor [Rhodocyclaceae bacterium]|nr:TonB-dependent receptor [Rhodocyclaceae bacterium]
MTPKKSRLPALALPATFAASWAAVQPGFAQERVLSEVTVSAAVSDIEERRQSATQKIIIDRRGIEATGGLYVGEVLSKLPGVDAGVPSSDGTVALRSRGMVRDSVQVLVDGERPPGDARHALLIVARMPAGELEKVEIVKGASAEFGSATPVTVNLITNKAKRKDALAFKVAGGFRDGDPFGQVSATKTGNSGNWSWSIPLTLSESRTPVRRSLDRQSFAAGTRSAWQTEEERGHNAFRELYFGPKLNWKSGSSSMSIWPMLFAAQGTRRTAIDLSQYANPAAGTGLAPLLHRDDQEESRRYAGRLRIEGDTMAGETKYSGRLTLVRSARNGDTTRDSRTSQAFERTRRYETEINAGLRADTAWGDHIAAVGAEYVRLNRNDAQRYTGSFIGSESETARTANAVLWIQDEWAVSKAFTMTGGLRGEQLTLATSSASQSHSFLAPSLSTKTEFGQGWQFRTSLGSAIKLPKLDEVSNSPVRSISANTPVEPDRRGNPNLQPERSVSLDLAVEHYWPGEAAVAGLNAYVKNTSDFIERRARLEGARWVERPDNFGDAHHWGLEADGKLKSEPLGWKGGSLRSHLTLPHARVEDRHLGQTRAAREVPRYILTVGYDQTVPSLGSNFGLLLQETGETRSDVPGEQWASTRHRSILDAYWVKKLDRTVNLRINLQNILGDKSRRSLRAYSGGQEWQLGSSESIPRAVLLTVEGKW